MSKLNEGKAGGGQGRVAMGKWQPAKSCGKPFGTNDAVEGEGEEATGGQTKSTTPPPNANQQFPLPSAASSPSDCFVPLMASRGFCGCVAFSTRLLLQIIKVAPNKKPFTKFTVVSVDVKGRSSAKNQVIFLCRSWEHQRQQGRRPPGSSKSMGEGWQKENKEGS